MEEQNKRVDTTEQILGFFGFVIEWSVLPYWADFKVYEITSRDSEDINSKPWFDAKGANSLPNPVENTEEAEIYMQGHIKWDACSYVDISKTHWCGVNHFKKHCDLVKHLYHKAFELMGREPDEKWDE